MIHRQTLIVMNYQLLNTWSGNRLFILILIGIMVCIGLQTVEAAEYDSEESMMQKLFALHSRLASQGNLESITRLGVMYERGEGVEKNRNKAIDLYEFAANRGYQPAIENLANINAKKTSKSSSSNSVDNFRVPIPKKKVSYPNVAEQKQEKPEDKSKQDQVSKQAAKNEEDKLTQSKQVEDENQIKLKEEIKKVQETQEQLAKERARAEAARQELELIQKKRENKLKEQQALANKPKVQNQSNKQSHAKLNNPEQTKFSSNPCNTPAAKFMSTCN